MKIGVYDPYLDDCGGGEKYMMTIASILSQENSVDVFWDNKTDFYKVAERFNLDISNIKLVKNIFLKEVSTLKRLQISRKYDAIIFHSDGSLPLLLSKKLFVHIQKPIEVRHKSMLYNLKKNRVNLFFVNSEFTKSFIDRELRIDSTVIYPPVDLHPKKVKKENVILHVGRFRPVDKTNGSEDYKKQHILLKAFKEMVDRGLKNWRFVLAVSIQEGDEKIFEEFKKDAKEYPIEFQVNKSNTDLWEFYSKAKIYWHATGFGEDLEKNPERAEHFGISTVEAMGAGVVPVVINAGGQAEIVTDSKDGMLWKEIPELIEETLILIASSALLEELSKNAKKRAKDFTLEMFSKNIFEMIEI